MKIIEKKHPQKRDKKNKKELKINKNRKKELKIKKNEIIEK